MAFSSRSPVSCIDEFPHESRTRPCEGDVPRRDPAAPEARSAPDTQTDRLPQLGWMCCLIGLTERTALRIGHAALLLRIQSRLHIAGIPPSFANADPLAHAWAR